MSPFRDSWGKFSGVGFIRVVTEVIFRTFAHSPLRGAVGLGLCVFTFHLSFWVSFTSGHLCGLI